MLIQNSDKFISEVTSMVTRRSADDDYIRDFIDYSALADGPVADLGCFRGENSKLMLEAGVKSVLANDRSTANLAAFEQSLTKEERLRSILVAGDASRFCRALEPATLAGILAVNRRFFLTEENIRRSLELFFRILKPGGRLMVSALSDEMSWQSGGNLCSPQLVTEAFLAGFMVTDVVLSAGEYCPYSSEVDAYEHNQYWIVAQKPF